MSTYSPASRPPLSVQQVLLCGAMIVTLSMGIRHGFGLWLQPMTVAHGWTRETFALAMAVQNLAWGVAGPFSGMIADRFGAWRVLIAGSLCYALGLVLMAQANTPLALMGSTGLLIGLAQSATTYSVIYGVIGRTVSPERRSWAFGVAAAAGSFGQFTMVPVSNTLISSIGWQQALGGLAVASLLIVPLAFGLRERHVSTSAPGPRQSIGHALREAFGHRSFQLLTLGYFVCGFQLAFIGVHMPSYLKDHGMEPKLATTALALVGLFNIFGTYGVGMMGQKLPKRFLLSGIYFLRALAILVFLQTPLSDWSVWIFAAVMGLLWLSTVPPTNALVLQMFGPLHLSMLSGFVFFSHQVGSFMGVWLGGRLYDATGSYDLVWQMAIGLSLMAAAVNLPIRETAVPRTAPAA